MRTLSKARQREEDIETLRRMSGDPSLWAVVGGNIVAIILALVQGWDVGQIMWVYWGQSVVIGITNVIRIWNLDEFTTTGMTMNDKPVPETTRGKRMVATFFAFHYGFFHLIYSVFLWQQLPLASISFDDLVFMLMIIMGFYGSHGFSLWHNKNKDFKHKKPNLGTLMFYPYLRIIPMHIAIIFGSMLTSFGLGVLALLLFMGLKTLADAGTHMVEHHLFRKMGAPSGPVRMED